CHPPTIRVLNIRKALLLFHIQHLFALLYHVSSGLGWFKSAFTQGEALGAHLFECFFDTLSKDRPVRAVFAFFNIT
ncbi:MAG: hypothetical protein J6K00_04350, partial [Oscillospiraceae bacterium]|nr:hypothetical protein [Oscillospiraceae bacterium]